MKHKLKWRRKKKKNKKAEVLSLGSSLEKLFEIGAVTVNSGGHYVFTPDFIGHVEQIKQSPPGRIRQIKVAKDVGTRLVPQLLAVASTMKSRTDVENLIVAYYCIKTFTEKVPAKIDNKHLPSLAYGIWYVDKFKPKTCEILDV